jgi:hypothetical protein
VRAVAAAACALALFGCAPSALLPAPTSGDASRISTRFPRATLAELEHGRNLYSKRCSSCHELFEPARFDGKRWQTELSQMRDRAGLRDDEERLILQYLSAVGERPRDASNPS